MRINIFEIKGDLSTKYVGIGIITLLIWLIGSTTLFLLKLSNYLDKFFLICLVIYLLFVLIVKELNSHPRCKENRK